MGGFTLWCLPKGAGSALRLLAAIVQQFRRKSVSFVNQAGTLHTGGAAERSTAPTRRAFWWLGLSIGVSNLPASKTVINKFPPTIQKEVSRIIFIITHIRCPRHR